VFYLQQGCIWARWDDWASLIPINDASNTYTSATSPARPTFLHNGQLL
jgi:hypothetical protein